MAKEKETAAQETPAAAIQNNPEETVQETAKPDRRKKDPGQPTVLPFQLITAGNRARLDAIGKANDATLSLLLDAYENKIPSDAIENTTVQKLQDEIKSLNLRLQESGNAQSGLLNKWQNADNELKQLKQQIAGYEQQIAENNSKIAEKDQKISELEQTVSSNTDTASGITTQLQEKLQIMTNRATKAEDEVKDNRKTIDGLNAVKKKLEKKLNQVTNERDEARNAYLNTDRDEMLINANEYPEGDILHFFPAITASMLDLTAQRLTEQRKDGKEITPAMVLADMFNRYTIDRFNLWFYKWVLDDEDIIEIASSFDKRLASKKMIRAALGIH